MPRWASRITLEIEYVSGGLKLKAWLHHPADLSRKNPAILFLHGGFAFDTDDWTISQPYRDAGYVGCVGSIVRC